MLGGSDQVGKGILWVENSRYGEGEAEVGETWGNMDFVCDAAREIVDSF